MNNKLWSTLFSIVALTIIIAGCGSNGVNEAGSGNGNGQSSGQSAETNNQAAELSTEPLVFNNYGREVNIIDIAGVCWHFVQQ